jgi:eukaryotic translation initiation factor 2C
MAPPRGNPRGQQGSARGRGGGGIGPSRGQAQNAPTIASHVETIGVKRPGYGTGGRSIAVTTNHFPCVIPEGIIHHYDGNDPHSSSFT